MATGVPVPMSAAMENVTFEELPTNVYEPLKKFPTEFSN